MHNLVVFPQEENGKTVYVLLSGERRYRAMEYLEKRGDATWNTIKNCNVITTSLSENEKKVLLYSANLQFAAALRMNRSAARLLQNLWYVCRASRSI